MTDTYPTGLPGLQVEIRRTTHDVTQIQQAATRAEFRFAEADQLPMEWELKYTLRQNNRAGVDELARVLNFFAAHRGQTDAFNFVDPLDGNTYLARFAADSLEIERVVAGWYEVTVNLKAVIDPASSAPARPAAGDLVYPFAFPGLQIEIRRRDLWSSKILSADLPGTEARITHQEIAFYGWTLNLTMREDNRAGVNEAMALDRWFRYYRGKLRSFAFTDPVDGVAKTVRFDSDLELTREIPGWWSTEIQLASCLYTPTTTVTITGPTV